MNKTTTAGACAANPHPEAPETLRGAILRDARRATTEQRNRVYGEPYENLCRTSDIFFAQTGIRLLPSQIARLLIANKEARSAHTPGHYDSAVDAAAYGAIEVECVEREIALGWRTPEGLPSGLGWSEMMANGVCNPHAAVKEQF